VRDAGAFEAATVVLRVHGAVLSVQVDACLILALAAPDYVADAAEAAVEAALQALVALLRAPDASPETLLRAFAALYKLTPGAAAAARAGELGVVEALMGVLRTRADNAKVQDVGWFTLHALALRDEENVARAARAYAGSVATDALRARWTVSDGDAMVQFGAQLSAVRAAEEAAAAAPAAAAQKEQQQGAAREVRRADACARLCLAWTPASTV
jgi:hypothetical protein